MKNLPRKAVLSCGVAIGALAIASGAFAQQRAFDIPAQPATKAVPEFARQAGIQIISSGSDLRGLQAAPVKGEHDVRTALALMLAGTGLTVDSDDGSTIVLRKAAQDPQGSSAAGAGAEVEALIVTAQKREEDIQDVPIAISAFTQESLERSQIAGGPDLMTQIPNMTFTKTNFTTYSIQIRGIGTQAVSATTDAAVAVAFNNTPFIRNRFFEQEFYDLQRVEVLRGPQGTLYGRNATAGVVNIISAKPKFDFGAKLSGDVANYNSTRLEGMINLPLVEDKVALRLAGAWTKREGFVTNEITNAPIDGRDLWSTRLSLRLAPTDALDVNLIWEHFEEDDDRLRSGKQLCNRDDRTDIQGHAVSPTPGVSDYLLLFNQGCLPASMYSPDAYEAPNGFSLPYFRPLGILGLPINGDLDPYASLTQSRDLRVIESTVDPEYRAKSDLFELQVNFDLTEGLTLTSETAYNADTVFSMQDFNRFNTQSGAFLQPSDPDVLSRWRENKLLEGPNGGIFCDPQIGCADRLVGIDLSTGETRQFSQELRLSSDFDGPFNFSLGANFLRADILDKYYVFINTLTLYSATPWSSGGLGEWIPNVSDNSECLRRGFELADPNRVYGIQECSYIDPNPISSLDDLGYNYFLSKNPYKLISYALFGEAYYNVTDNLKVTAGLRFTVDKKEAPRIPSWLFAESTSGYPVLETLRQEWREPTGRLAIDWKPDLAFTDETLLYASYARGYKAGGANPPLPGTSVWDERNGGLVRDASLLKPKTFDAEYVDAFELGSKNTLFDGSVTLNMAAFYYDYKNYQISQIIDRSAVNYNFDAEVWGLEVEVDWRPLENLKLGFKGGYENTRVGDGEEAIDIMDRTAGREGWVVVRPFPTFSSNCILPIYTLAEGNDPLGDALNLNVYRLGNMGPCEDAYLFGNDPLTRLPYTDPPPTGAGIAGYPGYMGYDPNLDVGQNHGEGFAKPLGGNELPNAPNFTATLTADYTLPLPNEWLLTLHTDLYYQSEAWTRIFNTEGYDKLKAYTNINLAAIFTNEEAGWKVMAYVKNVMDRDSITGAFLFPDDVGLTTNVFLTEPRLYGLRVTKDFDGGPWWTGASLNHTGPYPLTVEIGGQIQRHDAPYDPMIPSFADEFSDAIRPLGSQNKDLDTGDGREIKITYQPSASWRISAAGRFGRTNNDVSREHLAESAGPRRCGVFTPAGWCDPNSSKYFGPGIWLEGTNWSDTSAQSREEHTIIDFSVERDFGFGLFSEGRSFLGLGMRHATLESTSEAAMHGIPDWNIVTGWTQPANYPTRHEYDAEFTADREFEGAGPILTWEAGADLLGNDEVGRLALDWALTGGVLFGKQNTSITGFEQEGYGKMLYVSYRHQWPMDPPVPVDIHRSDSVTVPLASAALGFSYELQRIKLSAGYRWERYYDAIDGGHLEKQDADRTIDGPYFKLSVGFGG